MTMWNKLGLIVAARMGSQRLPGKTLLPFGNKTMILFLINRLFSSQYASNIVLATTSNSEDIPLTTLAKANNVKVYCGSDTDLIERYLKVAEIYGFDYVVRITGDCPFVDGATLDDFLDKATQDKGDYDLISTKGFYPIGIDFELIKIKSLEEVYSKHAISLEDREHLTLYFYNNKNSFRIKHIQPPKRWPLSTQRFTVDTKSDYDFAQKIISQFNNEIFSVDELLTCANNLKIFS